MAEDDVIRRAYAVVSAEADIRDAAQALADAAVAMLRADAKIKQGADPDARGAFVLTRSGVKFYPLFPRAEDVRVADMAGSLVVKPRWNGSAQKFYSVGSHSIHVRDLIAWGFRFAPEWGPFAAVPPDLYAVAEALGLLHDAHEYVLPDVPRPLKPLLLGWGVFEDGIDGAIFGAFGLAERMSPEIEAIVKWADDVSLALEGMAFGPTGIMDHITMPPVPPVDEPLPDPEPVSETALRDALESAWERFAPVPTAADRAVDAKLREADAPAPLNESRRSWRDAAPKETGTSEWEKLLEDGR